MTQILKKVLKTSKSDSAFLYFVLEANEGYCFYSTLDESLGKDYRLIEISYTPEFNQQIDKLLEHCQKTFPIEIID